MAERITIPPPRPNPREALFDRLKNAPEEHAEALLDAYEVLQLARDKGLLEIVKGLLGSGEKVLWVVTQTLENDEVVSLLRNVASMIKIIGGMNPAVLENVEAVLLKTVQEAKAKKPPGILSILRRLSNVDSRRSLNTIAAVMETLGQNLSTADTVGRKRKKTFRHNA